MPFLRRLIETIDPSSKRKLVGTTTATYEDFQASAAKFFVGPPKQPAVVLTFPVGNGATVDVRFYIKLGDASSINLKKYGIRKLYFACHADLSTYSGGVPEITEQSVFTGRATFERDAAVNEVELFLDDDVVSA